MALLTTTKRKEYFKYLGLGDYNKENVKKFEKKYLPSKMFDNLEDAKEYRKEILWPNTNE